MHIRAERDGLADVLARAARGVSNRSPLPILQGVLCEVVGKTVRVTGTDTEITIRTNLEVEVLEEGRTVIPAKLAADAVRRLPAGAVSVSARDGEVIITGNGPRFKLREFSVEDFPKLDQGDGGEAVEADGKEVVGAINQVGVAASSDEARPTLMGVLFEEEGEGLRLVATDSYRLAVKDLPDIAIKRTSLVPYRALREIGRSIAEDRVAIGLGDREACFRSQRGSITARVIEATFPDYRQLLPSEYPNSLVLNKESFLEAIGRASLVAEDHIPIRLSLREGGVEVSVTRQEVGEETEHLEGRYEGEEMVIAFNSRYLVEGVNSVTTEEVVLWAINPVKPGLITGSEGTDFRYLLMPVRLN